MSYRKACLLWIFIVFTVPVFAIDHIDKDKGRWELNYLDVTPKENVTAWYLPFSTSNRTDIRTISVISSFGSPRSSFLAGHIHTGLDCMPKNSKEPVNVFAMAEGTVCSVHLGDPFQTVVIKHRLKDSSIVYTSYKHINDVLVKAGDVVNKDTKIARVLTKKEAKRFGGAYNHLHLEIRKSFDDFGCASWLTMSKTELNLRFYNPKDFMKRNIINK